MPLFDVMVKRPFQISFFLCWTPLLLLAQAIDFERIPNELGLSQNLISALFQDQQGFIWVGTKDGLNRFDGYQFKVFQHDPFDSATISNNHINCILEDRAGRLWAGTKSGLNLMDRKANTFQLFPLCSRQGQPTAGTDAGSSGCSRDVNSIMEDMDGNIWIGTLSGDIIRIEMPAEGVPLNQASLMVFKADDSPAGLWRKPVKRMVQDAAGTIWVSTFGRICLIQPQKSRDAYTIRRLSWEEVDAQWPNYDQEDFTYIHLGKRAMDNRFYSIFENDGSVWIATAGGFLKWIPQSKSYKLFPFQPDLIKASLSPLVSAFGVDGFIDKKGRIWLDGSLTLVIYDTLDQQIKERFHSSTNNTPAFFKAGIHSLLEDDAGNIWVGTNGNGLYKHTPHQKRFSGQKGAQRFATHSLRAICQTKDGSVWLGPTNQQLLRGNLETGVWKPIILDESRWAREYTDEFDQVYSMKEGPDGSLWAGTGKGLFRLHSFQKKEPEWEFFSIYDEESFYPNVLDIHIDPEGQIWLLTHFEFGIFDIASGKFTGTSFLEATGSNKEMGHNFLRIHQQNDSIFWLAHPGGLLKYEVASRSFSLFTNDPENPKSISHPNVKCIVPDPRAPDKYLWLGTGGGGLNRFEISTGVSIHYKKKNGLPDNVVYGVLEDDAGHLWMSTNQGLSRFNIQSGEFKNFRSNDGLQDNEFNSGAFFKNREGRLFFGGIRGFNAFLPEMVQDNEYRPPIVLTDFKLANRSVDIRQEGSPLAQDIAQTKAIVLDWKHNIFSFEFAALDFTKPGQNQYAYLLENFDDEWQFIGNQRIATFTNIDPGEYVFRVKGTNYDGTWNETGASLLITIRPPWWRTYWAYAGYILTLVLAVAGFFRFQLRRRLETAEVERIKELDMLKSRLYTNITHEFRTPLTVILGITEQLSSSQWLQALQKDTHAQIKSQFVLIDRNAQNLLNLINQLLDLSRLESGKLKINWIRADIIPFLQYLTESFSSMANDKEIQLTFYPEADSLMMDFDEKKIQNILNNLLSNALKFTPAGGRVVVHAHREIQDSKDFLKLKVRDNGVGIAPDKLPYVFDRFFQVESSATRQAEGTGIGLAFAKELVELLKGRIEVESQPLKGTTFIVSLPIHQAAPKAEPVLGTLHEPSPGDAGLRSLETEEAAWPEITEEDAKPHLLIVEDNLDVTTYIRQILEPFYQVHTAANGRSGIEQAREMIPDIIISDVMMPEVDGLELVEALKNDQRTSHIPIILLTAKATDEDRISGLRTGADAYLLKPFHKEELFVRLEKLVELRKALQQKYSADTALPAAAKASQQAPSLDELFIQKIREAIAEKMGDSDLGVIHLCRAVQLSNTQVFRKLKALTGLSPGRYILKMRLQKARTLLQTTDLNVSEAAYETGFTDPNYFSRAFRKEFGAPPSEMHK